MWAEWAVISKRALAEIYIFMEILIVQLPLYENLLSNFFGLYFYISTYSRLLYEIIEEDCKCTSGGMGRYLKPGYHGDLYEYTFFLRRLYKLSNTSGIRISKIKKRV